MWLRYNRQREHKHANWLYNNDWCVVKINSKVPVIVTGTFYFYTMLQKILIELFERDLNRLKDELNAYDIEDRMWVVVDGISNSGGNLALHLLGNLNHFIGAVLGNTGYVRNREAEFAEKNIPRADMLMRIDETKDMLNRVFVSLTDEQLNEMYPQDKWNQQNTTGFLLMHLATHFNYHLGQINYHRRLVK